MESEITPSISNSFKGYAFFKVDGKTYLYPEYSLYIISSRNPFRLAFIKIITNPSFDSFILLCISFNVVTMAITDYSIVDSAGNLIPDGSSINRFTDICNYIFIGIFTLELSLKVVSMGFIARRGAYLNDPWNWIDFVVVFTGLISLQGGQSLSGVRSLRLIRPLKFLTFIPQLKAIVTAIATTIPELIDLLVIVGLFFVVVAIIGVAIFGGPYMHTR